MSLTEYRRKREFSKTPEPGPVARAPKGKRPMFVVQLHHASRRHYDFRLQVGSTLKSWAVPKGPSYDPSVKRMAIEVEDHPLDYASFEGQIPKGQYGGGHVAQFDSGIWSTDGDAEAQLAKGHLRFELFGTKLKGGWHLVRTAKPAKQPQWLLFKDLDAYAGTLDADDLLGDVVAPPAEDLKRAGKGKAEKQRLTEIPQLATIKTDRWAARAQQLEGASKNRLPAGAFIPQLAKLGDAPPRGDQWVHELKWDGYRIMATVLKGTVRLWSRNAIEWTAKLPEVVGAIQTLGLESAALDGELIAARGTKQDFNLLQATLSGDAQGGLTLALFDLLHIDGIDIHAAPLRDRKALLQVLLSDPPAHLAFSSHVEGDGARAFGLAAKQGFEGIISKRADRPYHHGRNDDWRKTKSLASDEFAVVGFTAPKGSRSGFGSLLLATPDQQHGWRYVGKVGSGFSDALISDITKSLGVSSSAQPSVFVPKHDTDLRSAKWLSPQQVIEVNFRGFGKNGLLRQPTLKTMRPDKKPEDLLSSDSTPMKATSKKAQKTASANPHKFHNEIKEFHLSSPARVVFADTGTTKRDVADYYQAVMEWLLPEIVDRPLSIIRCTQGTGRPCFFQKHHTAGLELVDTVKLREESGDEADYLVVKNSRAIMELVQFNAIEFHPWGSTAKQPNRANRIVFDLDPGPNVPWSDVISAARRIRELLEALNLVSYVRTSGGKGLHVVVPLEPGNGWDVAKPFARSFAETMVATDPMKFIATATKKFRKGKIFIDYLRNGRGATSVASFSLRARPGAPVAMPLRWDELGKIKGGDAYDINSAVRRMKALKQHPWHGIEVVRQNLDKVLAQSKA